ncbi:MAG: UDP-2,3-diacylglucosamine diphosphatase LpxI [Alphaproteobacteria bacterium]|nr:UDP-2,3-diacylglucosamine diphosphatase LpxI [Alphaproteobacteria bacterium]
MTTLLPKLGIISGGGTAPLRVIETCRAQNRPYFVICLEGQADAGLASDAPHKWLPLGGFGQLRDLIAAEQIAEIVMIGRVRRPSLKELKPDWLALKSLTKIGFNMSGDDALLRGIGKTIEQECNVRMIGVQNILGGVLLREGKIGVHVPDEQAFCDIERGVKVARALGEVDVGQSVIVQQGLVLGVEAIEGTDALIARCAGLKREGPAPVLVKWAKPQQDARFDLPAIGPDTVKAAIKAGLKGIAAEAERSLLIDRDTTKQIADENNVFIIGIR